MKKFREEERRHPVYLDLGTKKHFIKKGEEKDVKVYLTKGGPRFKLMNTRRRKRRKSERDSIRDKTSS